MGLKLHGLAISTCTTRAVACLYEKGVEFELVPVDVKSGAQKQPTHLVLNPFGQIPAFQDDDLTLFESRAISKYVSYKYKDIGTDLLRLDSLSEAAIVGVWLEVEAHQYNPAISPLVYEILIKPKFGGTPSQEIIATQTDKLSKVLDVYEERLSKSKYLAGDYFTLADLHHLSYTHYLMFTDKASLINSRPYVKAWWEDISARPAWKKISAEMKF